MFGGGEDITAFLKSMHEQFEAQMVKLEKVDENYSKNKLQELLREATECIRQQLIILQMHYGKQLQFESFTEDVQAENHMNQPSPPSPPNPPQYTNSMGDRMEEDPLSFLNEEIDNAGMTPLPNSGMMAEDDELLSDSQDPIENYIVCLNLLLPFQLMYLKNTIVKQNMT